MEELTIDLTYGTALFEAAKETGKTDVIKDEALELVKIMDREREFCDFLKAPGISAVEKKDALRNIFHGKICDELLNFMYILIDKGRIIHFEKMVKVYLKLLDREEGLSYGTVYSVVELGEERIRELEEEASALLKENVRLKSEIDPELIGGIRILVDGKIIDASLKKRFDDLSRQIC